MKASGIFEHTHTPIKTFIINLKNRPDRKKNIITEFSDRHEFELEIIEPEAHAVPAVSLWNTLKHVIEENSNREFVIVCEDDHIFTQKYSKEILFNCIKEANNRKADILSGGG